MEPISNVISTTWFKRFEVARRVPFLSVIRMGEWSSLAWQENSRPKGKNTVADPSVDMKSDVEAINNGQGTRSGNLYTVNGRTYERFDNHLVPHSGPGFHSLDRGEFKALGIFNSQGNTPQALQNAIRTTNDATPQRALEIWRLGQ
jgi:hypothetical protein